MSSHRSSAQSSTREPHLAEGRNDALPDGAGVLVRERRSGDWKLTWSATDFLPPGWARRGRRRRRPRRAAPGPAASARPRSARPRAPPRRRRTRGPGARPGKLTTSSYSTRSGTWAKRSPGRARTRPTRPRAAPGELADPARPRASPPCRGAGRAAASARAPARCRAPRRASRPRPWRAGSRPGRSRRLASAPPGSFSPLGEIDARDLEEGDLLVPDGDVVRGRADEAFEKGRPQARRAPT